MEDEESFLDQLSQELEDKDPKYETILKLFDESLVNMTSELSMQQINIFITCQAIDDYTKNKLGYKDNEIISLTDTVLQRLLKLNIVIRRKRIKEFLEALHRTEKTTSNFRDVLKPKDII